MYGQIHDYWNFWSCAFLVVKVGTRIFGYQNYLRRQSGWCFMTELDHVKCLLIRMCKVPWEVSRLPQVVEMCLYTKGLFFIEELSVVVSKQSFSSLFSRYLSHGKKDKQRHHPRGCTVTRWLPGNSLSERHGNGQCITRFGLHLLGFTPLHGWYSETANDVQSGNESGVCYMMNYTWYTYDGYCHAKLPCPLKSFK